jgi:hypothetical protein
MRFLKIAYAIALGYWTAWKINARAISEGEAVRDAVLRDLSQSRLS